MKNVRTVTTTKNENSGGVTKHEQHHTNPETRKKLWLELAFVLNCMLVIWQHSNYAILKGRSTDQKQRRRMSVTRRK